MSLSAAQIMAGDEIRGSITGVRNMVNQIHSLLVHADETSAENLHSLHNILTCLGKVRSNLADLKETAKTLRMLGLSTKIQSTKTGKDLWTFMLLGEDISELSAVINSKSSDLEGRAASLINFVDDLFLRVMEMKEKQQQQARRVIKGASSVLDSLEKLSGKSILEAQRIAKRSERISGNIGEVVISMQYQDITRQALEMVHKNIESIGEICSGIDEHDATEAVDRAMIALKVARRSAWQATCLSETGGKIRQAIVSLMNSLRGVSSSIGEMAEVTSKVSTDSAAFLKELVEGMSSVTCFLNEIAQSGNETSEAMRSLASTVGGMSLFVGDIEHICEEIELIALNAHVKAAQAGKGGAGMGIIAGSIQRTAEESATHRGTLIESLGKVVGTAESLRHEIDEKSRGEERELDQLVRELGMLLDALRYLHEKAISLLDRIERDGRDLSDDISASIGQITIQNTATDEVAEVVSGLHHVAAQLLDRVPCTAADGLPFELDLTIGSRMTLEKKMELLMNLDLEDYDECFEDGSSNDGQTVELFDRTFDETGKKK